MKLRIRESGMKYNTYGNRKKVYTLIDGETGEVIDVFATEDAAESYAREYIRTWADEENPVDVDCFSRDEDCTDRYQSQYLWTLDSRDGGFW